MELDGAAVLERRPQRTGQALVRERIPNWVLEQALAGYFQRANLIGLQERVMVCITTAPIAQWLLRRGARLAAALDAPLLVLTVLDSHRFLSRDEGLRIEQCEQLCADLGGEFLRLEGRAVLSTLVEVARSRRITQIVLGQSRATSLAGLLRRPLSEQLQRQLRGLGIDLHLIGEPAAEPVAEPAAELER